MIRADHHHKVLVRVTGRLLDGREVDSFDQTGTVELQLGNNTVPPGLEQAIVGMELGEQRTALVRAKDAFGTRRADLVFRMADQELPEAVDLVVGTHLTVANNKGLRMKVLVTEVGNGQVVLDGNHPLAGLDMTFDIELLGILDGHSPN